MLEFNVSCPALNLILNKIDLFCKKYKNTESIFKNWFIDLLECWIVWFCTSLCLQISNGCRLGSVYPLNQNFQWIFVSVKIQIKSLLTGGNYFQVFSRTNKTTLLLFKLHGRIFQPRTQLQAMDLWQNYLILLGIRLTVVCIAEGHLLWQEMSDKPVINQNRRWNTVLFPFFMLWQGKEGFIDSWNSKDGSHIEK